MDSPRAHATEAVLPADRHGKSPLAAQILVGQPGRHIVHGSYDPVVIGSEKQRIVLGVGIGGPNKAVEEQDLRENQKIEVSAIGAA